MTAIAQCLSHTPVVHLRPLNGERQQRFEQAIRDAKAALKAFDPELVVVFGPDHYNGFFYNAMPPFCVGAEAVGIGDYQTLKGPLRVASDAAAALHRYLLTRDFDPAISYDMHVDHGVTQCLEQLFDEPPLFIPVFVNCVAAPLASCARVIAFGRAVGEFAKQGGRRVAFIGSGGLSHDAPLPSLDAAQGDARRKLVEWRQLPPPERAEREQRTLAAADAFARGQSQLAPLSPAWDRQVMSLIAEGAWGQLAAMADDDITRAGGRSAHEVRTWLAACSALSVHGEYRCEQSVYFEAPEWIVGYGALRAQSVAAGASRVS